MTVRRGRVPWVGLATISLLLAGANAACGGASPEVAAGPGARADREGPPTVPEGRRTAGSADGSAADWAPLDDLPDGVDASRGARPEPEVRSLDEAEEALARGFYGAVRGFLEGAGGESPRGRLMLGRLDLITGRYAEAEGHARSVASQEAMRVPALTLAGETLAARGALTQAERTFRSVADEPDAHRARVLLGRVLSRQGKPEARKWFYALIESYNDDTIGPRDGDGLAHVAMAAWGLGAYQDANDAFGQATRANRERAETQIEWARLFLEKYDAGHAEESIQQVLERNPDDPRARALLARIRIAQSFDFQAAEREIERALEVNPHLVAAHVTRAGMALRDGDHAQTRHHLDRALSIDGNHLEALSVRAAARLIEGDRRGFEQAERAVLARHPTYARMYTIIADYADWEHRYADIVTLARRAVRLDPDDGLAHATLGLNLMRTGDEEEGLRALREAWRRDRFNVQVYNTLNLYDDVIPQEYESLAKPPFVFRMHREERPILERYVPRLLTKAYGDMRRRYGLTPDGPIRIELYGHPEHFAVRTTGLPRLGVQGVCFGKVVTALSPRGGPFNWGQITWHELAHVFHLQLSKHRVPRWFTEGLAEYETLIARPEWKREMEHTLWQALQADRLPPLALMNRAFTHAESADAMMTAYYASSRIVQYIVERFGMPKVVRMLRAWGRAETTPQVVQGVLGLDLDTLDRDFRAHITEALASRAKDFSVDFARFTDLESLREAARRRPADPDAQAAVAAGLMVAGHHEEAVARARKVVTRAPSHPLARYLLARTALAAKARGEAAAHLRRILAGGVDGYEVRLLLARSLTGGQDTSAVRAELEAATRIDPDRAEAWMGLRALAIKDGDDDLRREALERMARIDEHDRGTFRELLPMLAQHGRGTALVEFGEMALLVDPHNPDTHRWLAEGHMQAGDPKAALFELDSALLAGPDSPGAIHLERARALVTLGRPGEAKRAADRAVAADRSLADEAAEVLAR
jgi:cellulose synthase operon protein C